MLLAALTAVVEPVPAPAAGVAEKTLLTPWPKGLGFKASDCLDLPASGVDGCAEIRGMA